MTMNRATIRVRVAALLLLLLAGASACDTKENRDPMLILDVTITQPVNETNQLYAVFHVNPVSPWAEPWFTLSSSQKQIIIPPFSLGSFPFYFEVIYDVDGNGIDSGDWYQGWYKQVDRTNVASILSPVVLPDVEFMVLDINLDVYGLVP